MLHLLPYLERISSTKMTILHHKRKNVFVHVHIRHYLTLASYGYRYHTTFAVISFISYLIDEWFSLYSILTKEQFFNIENNPNKEVFLCVSSFDKIRHDNISISCIVKAFTFVSFINYFVSKHLF